MTALLFINCFDPTPVKYQNHVLTTIGPTVSYESHDRPWAEWMRNVETVIDDVNDNDNCSYSMEIVGRAPQSIIMRIGLLSRLPCYMTGERPSGGPPAEHPTDLMLAPTIERKEFGGDMDVWFITMNPEHRTPSKVDLVHAMDVSIGTVSTATLSMPRLTAENYHLAKRQVAQIAIEAERPCRPIAVLTSAPLNIAFLIGRFMPPCATLLDMVHGKLVVAAPPMACACRRCFKK